MSEVTTGKLFDDFKVLIDDVEQLVSATASEAGGASPNCASVCHSRSKRGKKRWPSVKKNCASKLNRRNSAPQFSC